MSRLAKDIRDAKSQLIGLHDLAKSQGLTNADYLIRYGKSVVLDQTKPDYLSMESIINNDATDSIYTTTYFSSDMVVKILGRYPKKEVEEVLGESALYGSNRNWEGRDSAKVVYITYKPYGGPREGMNNQGVGDHIFEVTPSNLPNGWMPSRRGVNHFGYSDNIVYKIDSLLPQNFINWVNERPLEVKR